MITGEIYNQYVELSKIVRYTPLTPRRVADFISQLETIGILTARVISKGRHGQTKEIQLTMQLAELAHILNDGENNKRLLL
jgi:cell division control protein 6